jgi:hypothetical protein
MRCRGLLRLANPAYLKGFLFPGLLRVAPYCVPSGIRMVSISPSYPPLPEAYLDPVLFPSSQDSQQLQHRATEATCLTARCTFSQSVVKALGRRSETVPSCVVFSYRIVEIVWIVIRPRLLHLLETETRLRCEDAPPRLDLLEVSWWPIATLGFEG